MKPIGAEVRLTVGSDDPAFALDVGDAIVTRTRRVYVVVTSRQMRTRRQASRWAVRCVVAEWPPPAGARAILLTWWKRARRSPA